MNYQFDTNIIWNIYYSVGENDLLLQKRRYTFGEYSIKAGKVFSNINFN